MRVYILHIVYRRRGSAPVGRLALTVLAPSVLVDAPDRQLEHAAAGRPDRRRLEVHGVVALIAPPRARFSTTASVDDDDERDDDDVDVDVTALDDARRRSARHSVIVVIASDASTTAGRRVGTESKS